MRYLLITLSLVSFVFSDDYSFSDVNKQSEFERKRIYINQVDKKEMYISGSMYKSIGSMSTKYIYLYKFEIIQDQETLDEQSFLELIGLEQEATKLFKEQTDKYFSIQKDTVCNKLDQELFNILDKSEETYGHSKYVFAITSILFHGIGFTGLKNDNNSVSQENMYNMYAIHLLGVMSDFQLRNALLNPIYKYEYTEKTLRNFIYKQSYTDMQLKKLADAYNNKIYEEIKNYQ